MKSKENIYTCDICNNKMSEYSGIEFKGRSLSEWGLFKRHKKIHMCFECIYSIKIQREKTISKAAVKLYNDSEEILYLCPTCNTPVNRSTIHISLCPHCDQKIDWNKL